MTKKKSKNKCQFVNEKYDENSEKICFLLMRHLLTKKEVWIARLPCIVATFLFNFCTKHMWMGLVHWGVKWEVLDYINQEGVMRCP